MEGASRGNEMVLFKVKNAGGLVIKYVRVAVVNPGRLFFDLELSASAGQHLNSRYKH